MPLRKEGCDQSLGLNCIRKLYWVDCFANEVGNLDLFLAHMCKHMHICVHIHMHTHTYRVTARDHMPDPRVTTSKGMQ